MAYLRREFFTLPNFVTLARVYCVYKMVVEPDDLIQVFIFAFIAWITDGLDGLIARTFNMCSELGAHLDQYADWGLGSALLYTIFNAEHFTLTWYNAPLLTLISLYLVLRMRYLSVETTQVAKVKTFVQFLGGIVILGGHASGVDVILITGYVIVAGSLPLMYKSLQSYSSPSK
ncbi:CDP-alcohol phosphatidyltransferase family protein [Candidatus Kaiserbacteria bacterium]|nr:CDP-alcohol phosphatidyltransferase family protein [Candidatus Kaiserbacteria bacterium]